MNQPIFITGVERSGSTLIARIFDLCGAFSGEKTNMFENIPLGFLIRHSGIQSYSSSPVPLTKDLIFPEGWENKVLISLKDQDYKDGAWMFKSSLLTTTWPMWHKAFPNAKWIIVRRKTPDIIQSCMKTGYMTMFKNKNNLDKIGKATSEEGWKWLIHEYENKFVEMIQAGVNCKQIWPERMVTGDYQQIYEVLEWVGLPWNDQIVETIDPLLNKSRRK